jgi:hypothetical protein
LESITRTSLLRLRRPGTAVIDQKNTHQLCGAKTMTKERQSKKEGKKKPTMTPKEKKAAKKSKKESKFVQ